MGKPGVAVIGAGALGSVLAQRLAERDYPVRAVFNRTPARAQALARRVGAPIASASPSDMPAGVSLVFCCVPDDAIDEVAHVLCAARADWSGVVIAHTSGALTADVLYSLGELGAAVLSFHPLQTFAPGGGTEAFEGIYVALEGSPEAVTTGLGVVEDLGARPLRLMADAKTRYHLAASMASNFFVTLMALVQEVLASIDVDRREGAALMRPLVDGTWRNLAHLLPEEALTGPIVRGDQRTVAAHLDALAVHLPHLVPVYAALGTEAVRVAVRSSRLDPAEAQHVLDLLLAALDR